MISRIKFQNMTRSWWRFPDSNQGHIPFQGTALPTELNRLIIVVSNNTDYLNHEK